MSNIRVKKSLIETRFVATAEDIPNIKSKMGKDDVVRIVDEDIVNGIPNAPKKSLNNPKIEKFVNELNILIAQAVDSDGDAIGVVDTSSTWEEPYIYYPIEYKNGNLKITTKSQYKNEPEVEVIARRNMEMDGVGTLRNIRKMYNLAIKRNAKSSPSLGESEDSSADRSIEYGQREPELGDADWEELNRIIGEGEEVGSKKLTTDVTKFLDKLDLSSIKNAIKKINNPKEKAEVIIAFAERIGIPKTKLYPIINALKNISKE